MFLNQLKEENKELFLKLCVHAAMANDEFADEEKETIRLYCYEMEIPVHIPEIDSNLDELLSVMKNSTNETEKKIIAVEILELLKADNVYDEMEHIFFDKLKRAFEIDDKCCEEIEALLDQYTIVYKKLCAFVYN